jgi:hypothetical protein
VLEKSRARAKLVVACTRRDATLFGWAEAHAYCDGLGRTSLPVELMAGPGTTYRVRTFNGHDALIEALTAAGADVRSDEDSLVVTTPQGSDGRLIVAAAVQVASALSELVLVSNASKRGIGDVAAGVSRGP